MKKAALVMVLAACSGSVSAEVGLGISFKSDQATVYMPIDLSEHFRLEPALTYTSEDEGEELSMEHVNLGVGMFYQRTQAENLNLLIGGRVGYIETEYDTYSSSNEQRDGYYVAPTLGFEYFIVPKFSLGGEAGISYQSTSDSSNSNDAEKINTVSNLIARFYF